MNNAANIRLGVSPLSWINADFASLSNIAIDHCLSEAALIGYEGVEYEAFFCDLYDRMPGLLRARNLTCVGGWISTHLLENDLDTEIQALEEHMTALRHMGGHVVILAECSGTVHQDPNKSLADRPILETDQWQGLCRDLDYLAAYVLDRGMDVVYHVHCGTVVETAEDTRRLMEGTQNLGLLFDPGHIVLAGDDPMDVLAEHLDRIRHVQLKNVRGSVLREKRAQKASFASGVVDGIFTVPGDDFDPLEKPIDFEEVCYRLIEAEYDGWMMVEAEQDPTKADPFTYAQLAYVTLQSYLQRQKLRVGQTIRLG